MMKERIEDIEACRVCFTFALLVRAVSSARQPGVKVSGAVYVCSTLRYLFQVFNSEKWVSVAW